MDKRKAKNNPLKTFINIKQKVSGILIKFNRRRNKRSTERFIK